MENLLVLKFGGASVASPECFKNIAKIILEKKKQSEKIVVVVSAMGNTTDQLLELARTVHPNPPKREQDMLISVGERISISLLAMALDVLGVEAVSFTGSQSGIITCESHSDAKIINVRPHRIEAVLEKGKVAVVAGFQGVSRNGEITTLGRGGSDTSAIALAVALKAPVVEFYKDVPGVFSEDPKKNPKARHLPELSYDEALSLSNSGAKILHPRCVALAKKNGIQIRVLSFENSLKGQSIIGQYIHKNSEMSYEVETCSPI